MANDATDDDDIASEFQNGFINTHANHNQQQQQQQQLYYRLRRGALSFDLPLHSLLRDEESVEDYCYIKTRGEDDGEVNQELLNKFRLDFWKNVFDAFFAAGADFNARDGKLDTPLSIVLTYYCDRSFVSSPALMAFGLPLLRLLVGGGYGVDCGVKAGPRMISPLYTLLCICKIQLSKADAPKKKERNEDDSQQNSDDDHAEDNDDDADPDKVLETLSLNEIKSLVDLFIRNGADVDAVHGFDRIPKSPLSSSEAETIVTFSSSSSSPLMLPGSMAALHPFLSPSRDIHLQLRYMLANCFFFPPSYFLKSSASPPATNNGRQNDEEEVYSLTPVAHYTMIVDALQYLDFYGHGDRHSRTSLQNSYLSPRYPHPDCVRAQNDSTVSAETNSIALRLASETRELDYHNFSAFTVLFGLMNTVEASKYVAIMNKSYEELDSTRGDQDDGTGGHGNQSALDTFAAIRADPIRTRMRSFAIAAYLVEKHGANPTIPTGKALLTPTMMVVAASSVGGKEARENTMESLCRPAPPRRDRIYSVSGVVVDSSSSPLVVLLRRLHRVPAPCAFEKEIKANIDKASIRIEKSIIYPQALYPMDAITLQFKRAIAGDMVVMHQQKGSSSSSAAAAGADDPLATTSALTTDPLYRNLLGLLSTALYSSSLRIRNQSNTSAGATATTSDSFPSSSPSPYAFSDFLENISNISSNADLQKRFGVNATLPWTSDIAVHIPPEHHFYCLRQLIEREAFRRTVESVANDDDDDENDEVANADSAPRRGGPFPKLLSSKFVRRLFEEIKAVIDCPTAAATAKQLGGKEEQKENTCDSLLSIACSLEGLEIRRRTASGGKHLSVSIDFSLIEYLLLSGANPTTPNAFGGLPLNHVIQHCSASIIKSLLRYLFMGNNLFGELTYDLPYPFNFLCYGTPLFYGSTIYDRIVRRTQLAALRQLKKSTAARVFVIGGRTFNNESFVPRLFFDRDDLFGDFPEKDGDVPAANKAGKRVVDPLRDAVVRATRASVPFIEEYCLEVLADHEMMVAAFVDKIYYVLNLFENAYEEGGKSESGEGTQQQCTNSAANSSASPKAPFLDCIFTHQADLSDPRVSHASLYDAIPSLFPFSFSSSSAASGNPPQSSSAAASPDDCAAPHHGKYFTCGEDPTSTHQYEALAKRLKSTLRPPGADFPAAQEGTLGLCALHTVIAHGIYEATNVITHFSFDRHVSKDEIRRAEDEAAAAAVAATTADPPPQRSQFQHRRHPRAYFQSILRNLQKEVLEDEDWATIGYDWESDDEDYDDDDDSDATAAAAPQMHANPPADDDSRNHRTSTGGSDGTGDVGGGRKIGGSGADDPYKGPRKPRTGNNHFGFNQQYIHEQSHRLSLSLLSIPTRVMLALIDRMEQGLERCATAANTAAAPATTTFSGPSLTPTASASADVPTAPPPPPLTLPPDALLGDTLLHTLTTYIRDKCVFNSAYVKLHCKLHGMRRLRNGKGGRGSRNKRHCEDGSGQGGSSDKEEEEEGTHHHDHEGNDTDIANIPPFIPADLRRAPYVYSRHDCPEIPGYARGTPFCLKSSPFSYLPLFTLLNLVRRFSTAATAAGVGPSIHIDINAKNNCGRTPLHLLCSEILLNVSHSERPTCHESLSFYDFEDLPPPLRSRNGGGAQQQQPLRRRRQFCPSTVYRHNALERPDSAANYFPSEYRNDPKGQHNHVYPKSCDDEVLQTHQANFLMEVVAYFIDVLGADIHIADNDGYTPLHLLMRSMGYTFSYPHLRVKLIQFILKRYAAAPSSSSSARHQGVGSDDDEQHHRFGSKRPRSEVNDSDPRTAAGGNYYDGSSSAAAAASAISHDGAKAISSSDATRLASAANTVDAHGRSLLLIMCMRGSYHDGTASLFIRPNAGLLPRDASRSSSPSSLATSPKYYSSSSSFSDRAAAMFDIPLYNEQHHQRATHTDEIYSGNGPYDAIRRGVDFEGSINSVDGILRRVVIEDLPSIESIHSDAPSLPYSRLISERGYISTPSRFVLPLDEDEQLRNSGSGSDPKSEPDPLVYRVASFEEFDFLMSLLAAPSTTSVPSASSPSRCSATDPMMLADKDGRLPLHELASRCNTQYNVKCFETLLGYAEKYMTTMMKMQSSSPLASVSSPSPPLSNGNTAATTTTTTATTALLNSIDGFGKSLLLAATSLIPNNIDCNSHIINTKADERKKRMLSEQLKCFTSIMRSRYNVVSLVTSKLAASPFASGSYSLSSSSSSCADIWARRPHLVRYALHNIIAVFSSVTATHFGSPSQHAPPFTHSNLFNNNYNTLSYRCGDEISQKTKESLRSEGCGGDGGGSIGECYTVFEDLFHAFVGRLVGFHVGTSGHQANGTTIMAPTSAAASSFSPLHLTPSFVVTSADGDREGRPAPICGEWLHIATPDADGMTPLHYAIDRGSPELILYFIDCIRKMKTIINSGGGDQTPSSSSSLLASSQQQQLRKQHQEEFVVNPFMIPNKLGVLPIYTFYARYQYYHQMHFMSNFFSANEIDFFPAPADAPARKIPWLTNAGMAHANGCHYFPPKNIPSHAELMDLFVAVTTAFVEAGGDVNCVPMRVPISSTTTTNNDDATCIGTRIINTSLLNMCLFSDDLIKILLSENTCKSGSDQEDTNSGDGDGDGGEDKPQQSTRSAVVGFSASPCIPDDRGNLPFQNMIALREHALKHECDAAYRSLRTINKRQTIEGMYGVFRNNCLMKPATVPHQTLRLFIDHPLFDVFARDAFGTTAMLALCSQQCPNPSMIVYLAEKERRSLQLQRNQPSNSPSSSVMMRDLDGRLPLQAFLSRRHRSIFTAPYWQCNVLRNNHNKLRQQQQQVSSVPAPASQQPAVGGGGTEEQQEDEKWIPSAFGDVERGDEEKWTNKEIIMKQPASPDDHRSDSDHRFDEFAMAMVDTFQPSVVDDSFHRDVDIMVITMRIIDLFVTLSDGACLNAIEGVISSSASSSSPSSNGQSLNGGDQNVPPPPPPPRCGFTFATHDRLRAPKEYIAGMTPLMVIIHHFKFNHEIETQNTIANTVTPSIISALSHANAATAPIHQTLSIGRNPLSAAMMLPAATHRLIRYLIQKGADPTIRDAFGRLPLICYLKYLRLHNEKEEEMLYYATETHRATRSHQSLPLRRRPPHAATATAEGDDDNDNARTDSSNIGVSTVETSTSTTKTKSDRSSSAPSCLLEVPAAAFEATLKHNKATIFGFTADINGDPRRVLAPIKNGDRGHHLPVTDIFFEPEAVALLLSDERKGLSVYNKHSYLTFQTIATVYAFAHYRRYRRITTNTTASAAAVIDEKEQHDDVLLGAEREEEDGDVINAGCGKRITGRLTPLSVLLLDRGDNPNSPPIARAALARVLVELGASMTVPSHFETAGDGEEADRSSDSSSRIPSAGKTSKSKSHRNCVVTVQKKYFPNICRPSSSSPCFSFSRWNGGEVGGEGSRPQPLNHSAFSMILQYIHIDSSRGQEHKSSSHDHNRHLSSSQPRSSSSSSSSRSLVERNHSTVVLSSGPLRLALRSSSSSSSLSAFASTLSSISHLIGHYIQKSLAIGGGPSPFIVQRLRLIEKLDNLIDYDQRQIDDLTRRVETHDLRQMRRKQWLDFDDEDFYNEIDETGNHFHSAGGEYLYRQNREVENVVEAGGDVVIPTDGATTDRSDCLALRNVFTERKLMLSYYRQLVKRELRSGVENSSLTLLFRDICNDIARICHTSMELGRYREKLSQGFYLPHNEFKISDFERALVGSAVEHFKLNQINNGNGGGGGQVPPAEFDVTMGGAPSSPRQAHVARQKKIVPMMYYRRSAGPTTEEEEEGEDTYDEEAQRRRDVADISEGDDAPNNDTDDNDNAAVDPNDGNGSSSSSSSPSPARTSDAQARTTTRVRGDNATAQPPAAAVAPFVSANAHNYDFIDYEAEMTMRSAEDPNHHQQGGGNGGGGMNRTICYAGVIRMLMDTTGVTLADFGFSRRIRRDLIQFVTSLEDSAPEV